MPTPFFRSFLPVGLALSLLPTDLKAQSAAATDPPLDAKAQQLRKTASDLEAALAKTVDTTPAGAAALLALVDHYYNSAQVIGVIRHAKRFTDAHATHAKHKDVMLKLLEAQQLASRHTDVAATARQFLERYPSDPQGVQASRALMESLRLTGRKKEAADAGHQAWKLYGLGAYAEAVQAMRLYTEVDQKEGWTPMAEIGNGLLEKLPADSRAAEIGWEAFRAARRTGDWALAKQIGDRLVAKKFTYSKSEQQKLAWDLAETERNLGKPADAVPHLQRAHALGDDEEVLRILILTLNDAKAKAATIAPLVQEYQKKYPTSEYNWDLAATVPQALERDGDKAGAVAATVAIMEVNAHGVREFLNRERLLTWLGGDTPEAATKAEKILRSALAKKPENSWRIHWMLGFDIYRDRLKDEKKARETIRTMLFQATPTDGSAGQALTWLLDSAASEEEFQNDVTQWITAAKARPESSQIREHLHEWVKERLKAKETASRAKWAKERHDAFHNDPIIKLWAATQREGVPHAGPREELLKQNLTPAQRWSVLSRQAESFRNQGNEQASRKALPLYAELSKLRPDDSEVARIWLYLATAFGSAEEQRAAAEKTLSFPPLRAPQAWHDLLEIAKKQKDAELAKRSLTWIQAAEKAHGPSVENAGGIGSALVELGLKEQGFNYWKEHVSVDRNHWEGHACAGKVFEQLPEKSDERIALAQQLIEPDTIYHGAYAAWLAHEYLQRKDFANFESVLRAALKRREARPLGGWGMNEYPARDWMNRTRDDKELTDAQRRTMQRVIRDLQLGAVSADAALSLAVAEPPTNPLERIRVWQQASASCGNSDGAWETLRPFAQAALVRGETAEAAALFSGMLANITQVDGSKREVARSAIRQAFARMGVVGFDGKSGGPAAPLLAISAHLQLGDESLAVKTYADNRELFDKHLLDLPIDVIGFAAEQHITAGKETEHDRAEDILRKWIIKYSEEKDVPVADKARIQLLLARNYNLAGRWEAARSEYTTVVNRYAATEEALEARLGIGETYMAQKVFDQADEIFTTLATTAPPKIGLRAEFLRGVLAGQKGEREEARKIFREVLDRMPDIKLADRTLFELAQVYGIEQRYMEQLDLLRTVGRLGRQSNKWHVPGRALSVVVQDPDLGISRGHTRIPVLVKTEPGGDQETVWLTSGGGGRGLFMGDVPTALGAATSGDSMLQVNGSDTITVDYPAEFKAQFGFQGLPQSRIRLAADATFNMASATIVEAGESNFTNQLAQEAADAKSADERRSIQRPASEVKPGNLVYLRVKDPDRDLSDKTDVLPVKIAASSGDQTAAQLTETGPHTGVFEGTMQTGDLPAGALASDQSIGRSPLMAIDQSAETAWLSEPDGLTPKWLSVDMKALRDVSSVSLTTPDIKKGAPKRFTLQGSHDGRFLYRLADFPARAADPAPKAKADGLVQRVWKLDRARFDHWPQAIEWLDKHPPEESKCETLAWKPAAETDAKEKPAHAVMWAGKFVQPRDGAVRFQVSGDQTAVMVNGVLEGWREAQSKASATQPAWVDVYLPRGLHDLVFLSVVKDASQGVSVIRARENPNTPAVTMLPCSKADFNVSTPEAAELAKVTVESPAPKVIETEGRWDIQFPVRKLRDVRFLIHEYSGDAVAVNQVTISGPEANVWIPTAADILALGQNNILEIAASDTITGAYIDELTEDGIAQNRELKQSLTATYFNGSISAVSFDFNRQANGTMQENAKELLRIDPGERVTLEVTDFDLDQTGQPDTIPVSIDPGTGKLIELMATETGPTTGIFRAHMDTVAAPTEGKLHVTPGQRLILSYEDVQNNFPGHRQRREATVFVRTPTDGRVRIVESRMIPPPPVPAESQAADVVPVAPKFTYLPTSEGAENAVRGVCYQLPLSIEIIDPDAAKDSQSEVIVTLTTGKGQPVQVACKISNTLGTTDPAMEEVSNPALWQGRFFGQVIMKLGGPNSPQLIPVTNELYPRVEGRVLPPPPSAEPNAAATETPAPPPATDDLMISVFNVGGKDLINATYRDADRKSGDASELKESAQIMSDGVLALTDETYTAPIKTLHLGDRIYVRLEDADRDTSDGRDKVIVMFTSAQGEEESVELDETLSHSGIFTGSFALKANEKPQKNNHASAVDPFIEGFFGEALTAVYLDDRAASQPGQLVVKSEVQLAGGSDGQLAAFSKIFGDEELAIQTQFTIAESFFEMFKSHLKLERKEEAAQDLAAGRKVLQELAEDYPGPKYAARVAYLTGQFAQEMKDWKAAIVAYETIVRDHPGHTLAADAQFKLGQCQEEAGDFDKALEAYVTLAASYPKSPLIANAMVRMSEYFYTKENFTVAAQVGEKFIERFDNHQWAPKIAFRVGQCYYKDKQYAKGGKAFDALVKKFPEDELTPQALFWAGECFRTGNDVPNAFRRYNRCRWDFPESEAAKFARGRLALPEMLAQFEREAEIDEDK